MTALTDIQKALNTIRAITQQEAEAVRLEALALMAGVIGDEARDIEKRREPKPKRTQRIVAPVPRPAKPTAGNAPAPTTRTAQTAPDVQDQAPKQPQKPIPPR
ncbi:hypothetical protein SAMN05444421_11065 [Celeribacter marinus]|nr:hypothetical protein SAMN05444421_11065 [Celeribacter marinus]